MLLLVVLTDNCVITCCVNGQLCDYVLYCVKLCYYVLYVLMDSCVVTCCVNGQLCYYVLC